MQFQRLSLSMNAKAFLEQFRINFERQLLYGHRGLHYTLLYYLAQVLRFGYCQLPLRRSSITLAAVAYMKCYTGMDKIRTESLLFLSHMIIHHSMTILTDHCPYSRFTAKLGIPTNDFCRYSCAERRKGTLFHLICQETALVVMR